MQSGPGREVETEHLRELADQLGASFVVLGGSDVAGAIIQDRYFALLYQLRGFGIAVGAHTGYDLLVGVLMV